MRAFGGWRTPRLSAPFSCGYTISTHGRYFDRSGYEGYFTEAHPVEPVKLEDLPKYQLHYDAETGEPVTDLGIIGACMTRGSLL